MPQPSAPQATDFYCLAITTLLHSIVSDRWCLRNFIFHLHVLPTNMKLCNIKYKIFDTLSTARVKFPLRWTYEQHTVNEAAMHTALENSEKILFTSRMRKENQEFQYEHRKNSLVEEYIMMVIAISFHFLPWFFFAPLKNQFQSVFPSCWRLKWRTLKR